MTKREFKNSVYLELSRISKVFSHANRLEIIDLIANGPKSVEDIAYQTGISIGNASQHLQLLKKERLVKTNREGNKIYYSLTSDEVYLTLSSIRELALKMSPHVRIIMDDFRAKSGFAVPSPLKEIKARGDVLYLDVRPADEYQQDHIANAISIPITELEQRIDELPKDRLIVTYCRGMFCTYADEAVQLLRAKGYQAERIEENVLDYQKVS